MLIALSIWRPEKLPQPARLCHSFISCVSLRVHPLFIPFIFYLFILFVLFYNFLFLLLLIPCFYLSYFISTFLFIHSLFFSSPAACEVQNELIYSLIQSSAQSLLHQVFVLFCFVFCCFRSPHASSGPPSRGESTSSVLWTNPPVHW